jgi:hypothetical protein
MIGWIRLYTRPKKVALWDRQHACDKEGYAVPNFEKSAPPHIRYLREQSYNRYRKTDEGQYLESFLKVCREVGKIESIRWVEFNG